MPILDSYNGKSAKIDSVMTPALDQSDISRVLPRQLSTGSLRGTQKVGYGKVNIDGSNNTITVGNILLDGTNDIIQVGTDTRGIQGLGKVPGPNNEYGMFQTNRDGTVIWKLVSGETYVYDSSAKLIWKLVNGTISVYNKNDNYLNSELIGFAPDDGRPGIWVAKPGKDATVLLS